MGNMKLWLLSRKIEKGYGATDHFIVRACDPEQAFQLVSEDRTGQHELKSKEDWTCEELTGDGPAEVILNDYTD